jgi:polysaccharide deacetylase family protein (PEP-CTERM system associated)
MINYLTIDVEDWFHVTNYAGVISQSQWDRMEQRLPSSLGRVLDVLDDCRVNATFFILGWVAEHHPDLVQVIADRGHEVACHGYSHELVYNLGPEGFREDLGRALALLGGAISSAVIGYRAPSFTITAQTTWAYPILAEMGFRYDSSVFPIRRKCYGIPDAPMCPYDVETPITRIREFPLATWEVMGFRVPVGGGGYFRLYPYWLTAAGVRHLNHRGYPAVMYIHPWELDPEQPIPPGSTWRSRCKHRINLKSTERKLRRLCEEFQFRPLRVGLD